MGHVAKLNIYVCRQTGFISNLRQRRKIFSGPTITQLKLKWKIKATNENTRSAQKKHSCLSFRFLEIVS